MRGRIVTVVEDDPDLRQALISLLRSLGYSGHAFPDAESFLASPELHVSQCIVTDISLPGLSGIDLKHWLDTHRFQIPTILITARTDAGTRRRAQGCRSFCLLTKPFETADLIACIDRALAGDADRTPVR